MSDPSTAASVAGKAGARPELEQQDMSTLRRKFIV
jgi:hypothetical protein